MRKLIHYANPNAPLTRVESCEQEFIEFPMDKPRGLWVSCEGHDDWKSWCEANDFSIGRKLAYEIELVKHHNVLHISRQSMLRDFHAVYAIPIRSGSLLQTGINWLEVAEHWSGVIIAPYLGAYSRFLLRGLDFLWYAGWDCASGCIWNADAIANVKPLGEVVFRAVVDMAAEREL